MVSECLKLKPEIADLSSIITKVRILDNDICPNFNGQNEFPYQLPGISTCNLMGDRTIIMSCLLVIMADKTPLGQALVCLNVQKNQEHLLPTR